MSGKNPGPLRSVLLPLFVLLLLAAMGCRSSAVVRSTSHFPPGTGFVERQVTLDGQPRKLWVFVPKDYDPAKRYPAVVFLHGLFEAGSDGDNALSGGLAPVIARSPDAWPFVVIFPQSDGTWRGPRRDRLAMQSLDWAQREYSIDRRRVILAGLSYGALGTWQIGARHPDRFAAIVAVAGRGDRTCADELKDVPAWAFHRSGDPFMPARSAAEMCERITRLGGEARYTGFAGVGHDCWDAAVAQTDLVDWMLRQRTPVALSAAE